MSDRAVRPFDEARAQAVLADLLAAFGEDPSSEELRETPARVAEFWKERLAGYAVDLGEELKPLPGDLAPVPVILENIPFVSTCEHHLAPFEGKVTVGYLPGEGGTVGLSKLVRVVQAFAWRLQVQERMTRQMADALEHHLRPRAWAVKVVATHTCMSHRGVKTPDVPVTTVVVGGTWAGEPPGVFR
ncbi:MAG: GTP cyclohydrolase I [Holophagaceae bacterium]